MMAFIEYELPRSTHTPFEEGIAKSNRRIDVMLCGEGEGGLLSGRSMQTNLLEEAGDNLDLWADESGLG